MSNLLIIGPPGSGKCKLLESIIESFENVVWVTTTSSIEIVRKRVRHDNLWIIDTFTWKERETLTEKDIVVKNPLNLNEISLSITKILEKLGGDYLLVVNSISGLLVYHNYQKLIHFLRSLLVRVEDDGASGAFTLIKNAHERNVEISISMFFPNILMMERGNLEFVKTIVAVGDRTLDFKSERVKELIVEILRSK